MSFAIIRNTKYKRENLKGIYRHNERKNKNYSNDNIDKEKSYLNYSLKSSKYRYDKEFDIGAEDNLIRDFEKETRTYLDAEKQIKKEDREKEWELEI